MTSSAASLPEDPTPAPASPLRKGWVLRAALAAGVLAVAAAAWHGGVLGLAAVVVAALALAVGSRHLQPASADTGAAAEPSGEPAPAPRGPARPAVGEDGSRVGAEVMVSQVVPVWSRQMEVTRDVVTEGLAKLLENFAGVSGALGDLAGQLESFNPVAAPGMVDEAVQGQSAAMDALLAPSRRAFQQRDDMMAVLSRCSEALVELQQQAKHAHEISRHTRLVAFNASIEAHRTGVAANGSQAVAQELRELAARMAGTGETVHRLVSRLASDLGSARLAGDVDDTRPDELRLELQIKAREALGAMLGTLGTSLGGNRAIKESADQLRNSVEEAFVNFQFGDRVAQMLSIVGNDMSNFARWVSRHPHASQSDAAEWLEALEASYTMEEQRAHHHGNVHVDRGSEIEFF